MKINLWHETIQWKIVYEYHERFKKLYTRCPHHQISRHLLLQHFYKGLILMEINMVDTASGRPLMNKALHKVKNLIATIVTNSQQFGICSNSQGKVNEISNNSNVEVQVNNLTLWCNN